MNTHWYLRRVSVPSVIGLATLGVTFWMTGASAQEILPVPPNGAAATAEDNADADMEVLARGPLHEAYASPFTGEPLPGEIVPQAPPEPIEEIPPEVALEGEDVAWIPGYWGWDPDQQDFVWISGVWRKAPPGQKWVPGYWREADQGYQWVSGFWLDEAADDITYLPTPPETLDVGPASPAPGDDYFWIPGSWVWQSYQYVWRPGYWSPLHTNWVWTPAQYIWTPRGCVFTRGFWDYALANRGLLYAPVYYHRPIYLRPSYFYTPSYVVQVPYTLVSWFVAPRYRHYYFGNYYGLTLGGFNLLPWYTFGIHRTYYDPLLVYYRSYYRRYNTDFIGRLHRWHDYYHRHEDRRPPKWVRWDRDDWRGRDGRRDGDRRDGRRDGRGGDFDRAVVPVSRWASDDNNRRRVRQLDENRRREIAQGSDRWRDIRSFRNREEGDARRVADARRDGDVRRNGDFRRGADGRRDEASRQARRGPLIAPDNASRVELPESLRGRRGDRGVAAGEGSRARGGERVGSAARRAGDDQRGRGNVARRPDGEDRRGGPPQDPRARVRGDGPIDGTRTPSVRRSDLPRRGDAGDVRRSVPERVERPGSPDQRRVFRPDSQPPQSLRRTPQEGIRRPGEGRPSISPGRPVDGDRVRQQGRDIRSIPGAGRPDVQFPSRRDIQPRIQGPVPDQGRGRSPSEFRQAPQQVRPSIPSDRGGRPPVQLDRSPRSRTTSPRAVIRPDGGSARQRSGGDVRARVSPETFRRPSSASRSIRSAPQRSSGRSSFSSQGGNRGRSSQGNRGGGNRGGGRGRGNRGGR